MPVQAFKILNHLKNLRGLTGCFFPFLKFYICAFTAIMG